LRAIHEYAPVVFGGIMLIAAFAFAGNYMGQSAVAHTATVDDQPITTGAPVTNIIAKGSLLPQGENFDIVNLNVAARQLVVSEGKTDYINADPNDQVAMPGKGSLKKLASKVVITPAAIDLRPKKVAAVEPATKRMSLAPTPANIASSFKLNNADKQAVVAQRRVRLAEENCLARAVYFEARSESELGQLAVARVILNRTKSPEYPKSICGVVYQGSGSRNSCQFSFACDGLPDDVRQPGAWANAKRIAQKAIAGMGSSSVISAATNYHADYVRPRWASGMRRLVKIGRHIFYSES
jgi:spore germination cell wall hydrolase CwlJ-like protein